MPLPVVGRRTPLSFDRFATAIVLGAAFVAACLRPIQSDVWWDLRAGKLVWHTGHIPTRDTWTLTAHGRFWPNHEWLWQAAAYPLHVIGGLPLLVTLNSLAAVGALVLARGLAPTGNRIGIVLLAFAVAAASGEWALRPQVISLLLFAVALTWLARDQVWRLPPLILVWANIHAGVAMGGLALGLALAVTLVRFVVHRDPESRARLLRLAIVTPLSALLTLATPLGTGLWTYVIGARSNGVYRDLPDWVSAFHLDSSTAVFWVWFVVWLVAVVLRRHRFVSYPTQLLLVVALVTAVLTMLALRNIGFFTLAALPSAIVALAPDTEPRTDRVPHGHAVLAVLGVLGVSLVVGTWVTQPPRLEWYPLSRAAVSAVRACPTPIYNAVILGGPIEWEAPDVVTFIDSRIDPFPPALVHQDRLFETGSSQRPLFEPYGVRCAVLPRQSVGAARLTRNGWHTTYADPSVIVLTAP